jgi:hypothetical protein
MSLCCEEVILFLTIGKNLSFVFVSIVSVYHFKILTILDYQSLSYLVHFTYLCIVSSILLFSILFQVYLFSFYSSNDFQFDFFPLVTEKVFQFFFIFPIFLTLVLQVFVIVFN